MSRFWRLKYSSFPSIFGKFLHPSIRGRNSRKHFQPPHQKLKKINLFCTSHDVEWKTDYKTLYCRGSSCCSPHVTLIQSQVNNLLQYQVLAWLSSFSLVRRDRHFPISTDRHVSVLLNFSPNKIYAGQMKHQLDATLCRFYSAESHYKFRAQAPIIRSI